MTYTCTYASASNVVKILKTPGLHLESWGFVAPLTHPLSNPFLGKWDSRGRTKVLPADTVP